MSNRVQPWMRELGYASSDTRVPATEPDPALWFVETPGGKTIVKKAYFNTVDALMRKPSYGDPSILSAINLSSLRVKRSA